MNYHKYIVRNPKICAGEPVFKGTRVTLRTILASLAEGEDAKSLMASFPSLKPEHLTAAIAFASASAMDVLPQRKPLKI